MKVGIVCPYDIGVPGGVQQVCLELATRLGEAGEQAVVVAPGDPSVQGLANLPEPAATVGRSIRIPANGSVSPIALSVSSWSETREALAGVDVIHVHEPLMPVVGWAALSLGAPMVATFHADPPGWVKPLYKVVPVQNRMQETVLTAASPVAARSVPPRWGNVRIVPNAVHVASYSSDEPRVAKRIAFLGRDEPRKGLDIALDAFSEIRGTHPDSELVVMSADRTDPPDGVTYLGRVTEDEKRRVLATSEIYLAPNTGGESFGIVLAEAMASGCAVVASDIPGFRAVLGGDGILIPSGDSAGFAEAISGLLDDRDRSRRLGEQGLRAIARYDWPVVFEQYQEAYRDACR